MKLPAWALKLAAASVIPAMIGMGVALSAPSPVAHVSDVAVDDSYRPGADGVDFASVTGPERSGEGRAPACADPASGLRPCVK